MSTSRRTSLSGASSSARFRSPHKRGGFLSGSDYSFSGNEDFSSSDEGRGENHRKEKSSRSMASISKRTTKVSGSKSPVGGSIIATVASSSRSTINSRGAAIGRGRSRLDLRGNKRDHKLRRERTNSWSEDDCIDDNGGGLSPPPESSLHSVPSDAPTYFTNRTRTPSPTEDNRDRSLSDRDTETIASRVASWAGDNSCLSSGSTGEVDRGDVRGGGASSRGGGGGGGRSRSVERGRQDQSVNRRKISTLSDNSSNNVHHQQRQMVNRNTLGTPSTSSYNSFSSSNRNNAGRSSLHNMNQHISSAQDSQDPSLEPNVGSSLRDRDNITGTTTGSRTLSQSRNSSSSAVNPRCGFGTDRVDRRNRSESPINEKHRNEGQNGHSGCNKKSTEEKTTAASSGQKSSSSKENQSTQKSSPDKEEKNSSNSSKKKSTSILRISNENDKGGLLQLTTNNFYEEAGNRNFYQPLLESSRIQFRQAQIPNDISIAFVYVLADLILLQLHHSVHGIPDGFNRLQLICTILEHRKVRALHPYIAVQLLYRGRELTTLVSFIDLGSINRTEYRQV